jgi:preprotein translocase subunit SecG
MQMLMNVVVGVQILAAIVMIGLVLVQHGKGADMGASFGSGSSGSLFGATGSANFLSRSTAVAAGLFFCSTLALAYFANDRSRDGAPAGESSVLDRAAASAPGASAVTGAAQIPGNVMAASAASAVSVQSIASAPAQVASAAAPAAAPIK